MRRSGHLACPYEQIYAAEFRGVKEDLHDLKTRVGRLETVIERGVLLLLANLVGVIVTLVQQLV
jgi:hypothetical protein